MTQALRRQSKISLRVKVLLVLTPVLLAIMAPLWTRQAAAQSIDSRWVIYKQEDGLASNNVWKILPTEGVIWFGTDNGVSRFDGEWRSWGIVDGFPAGNVKAIAAGNTVDQIWAATDRGALLQWNGDSWDQLLTLSAEIQVLYWVDGSLWIGTGAGLYILNGSEAIPVAEVGNVSVQSITALANTVWVGTSQGLWLRQRDNWSLVNADNGLPHNSVTALWVDVNGRVWVGTKEGIARQEPVTGAWLEIITENTEGRPFHIQALAGDSNGTVWGGMDEDGYFRIDESGSLRAFPGDFGLTTRFVHTVAVDNDDSVWFGTASGVFRYEENTWGKEVQDSIFFPGINYINAIEIDKDNRVWIGTQGAGIRVKPNGARLSLAEETYNGLLKPGQEEIEGQPIVSPLPNDNVYALVADENGNIWAGTEQGVTFFSKAEATWSAPFSADVLPAPLVSELLLEQNVLWIGTPGGLARYELETSMLASIDALAGKDVESLVLDSMRRLWVGTRSDGIFVQIGSEIWTQHAHRGDDETSISGNDIVALSADAGGGIWAAVDRHGLNFWDGERWHDYGDRIELPSKLLYTLFVDPVDGSLWIGSEGGVTRYDGRTWETLSVENILPNASIFSIGYTLDGTYLFGGKDGLTYYHQESTPPWIRIEPIAGAFTPLATNEIQTDLGTALGIRYVAGDLYTASNALDVIYRVSGPNLSGTWTAASGEFVNLPAFTELGTYAVEMVARDQAFNYSPPARLSVNVVTPPATVEVPLVGAVESELLFAFVIIGLVALVSLGYMSMGIVQSRRRAREAVVRGFNPFVSGEPVRREDMFFGRMELLQRIIDTLHNNSIMIHGERRIGKTTLLYQLAARLREVDDSEYWFIPLYIDLEGTTESGFFHFLMEEILSGAMTLPGAQESLPIEFKDLLYQTVPTDDYSDREFSRDLREVIKALQHYGEKHYPGKQLRMILLLDEMDVMSSYSRLVQQRLRRIFMRDFAATLGAVVAGIQISKDWDRVESPWYNLFNEIALGPFNREQAVQLLTEPISDFYRYEPAAIEFIIAHSGGRPYRLQQYALEAVNHMLAEGRREIRMKDVEYAHEHIQHRGSDTDIGLTKDAQTVEVSDVASTMPLLEGEQRES